MTHWLRFHISLQFRLQINEIELKVFYKYTLFDIEGWLDVLRRYNCYVSIQNKEKHF